jgi:hypothetical protein
MGYALIALVLLGVILVLLQSTLVEYADVI